MHMADALLSPAVGLGMDAAALGTLAWAARRFTREERHQEVIPLAGVLGAFVFGAQMLNFSIPVTGSSGHVGGGLLLALMLGPWAGLLTLAAVLVIQCLFFCDGGLLALGCNIFNLGFWPCLVGLPLYRWLASGRPGRGRRLLAAVAAVLVSLELGAAGVVVQTVLSGRSELPFAAFLPVMLGIHLPIALVEGVLTAVILQFVARTRPEIAAAAADSAGAAGGGWRRAAAGFALLALLFSGVLAWFASSRPDGLEWSVSRVSGREELPRAPAGLAAGLARIQEKTALFPDYSLPRRAPAAGTEATEATERTEGTPPAWPAVDAGTSLAGLVGAGLVGLLAAALAGLLLGLRKRMAGPAAGTR
ncbi:MAG: energy-coupling factor ABC transporter permease [Lentisphaeria bacterium]